MKNNLIKRLLKSTAAKLIAAFLMLSSGQSNAATSTNTNSALPWNTTSSGWTGVTGNAWDITNGQTNTAVFTNASGSITVTNSGIWFNGINYAPAAASSFTILGGTLNLSGSTPTINVSATTGSGLTISSQLAGTAGLIKSGVGVLTLSASNAYSGATTVSAGTLLLNNANAIKNSTSVTVANGATLQMAGFITYSNANAVTITGTGAPGQSGALRFGNGPTVWAAPIILNGNSTIYSYGGAANTTLNGAITGTGNLSLASTGGSPTHTAVWTLNAASTYNGSTVIRNNDGLLDMTVKLGVNDALPTTTRLNLEGTTAQATNTFTTLDLNGKNQTLAGLTDTNNSSSATNVAFGKRVINSGSLLSTLTLDIASGTNTYGTTGTRVLAGTIGGTTAAGVAANNLALTKIGAGTLVLAGNNTYTGATTVSSGTLLVNTGASITASASQLNGGTLDVRGIIGSVTQSGGTLLVSGTAGTTVINSGTSTVNSGGTIGSTTINGSLLSVNGSAGDVLVNSGGTLGGSGSVQGLTLNGGTVAPGNSPGLLTAYELNGSNGTFQFQLGAPTTRGTTYDAINVTTLLTLGSSTAFTFETLNSYAYAMGDVYDLFDFASIDVSVFDNSVLLAALPDLDTANSNLTWNVNSFNADGIVNVIPEPSTLSLMFGGLSGLIALRMMRKKIDNQLE